MAWLWNCLRPVSDPEAVRRVLKHAHPSILLTDQEAERIAIIVRTALAKRHPANSIKTYHEALVDATIRLRNSAISPRLDSTARYELAHEVAQKLKLFK